jgi:aldehyde dehydrogenase (NAD+)
MPAKVLDRLAVWNDPRVRPPGEGGGEHDRVVRNPATGKPLARVRLETRDALETALERSDDAFRRWRRVPAPQRGQVVRAIGDAFRANLEPLGELIALEMGKIRAEGVGEVQEVVDIADFAVGLSRQLHGITMPSERADHIMKEQWLPLGPVGVITAFNFPCAVWGWNAMLAAVCGDTVVWKPSLLAPLTAIATNRIASEVAESMGHKGLFSLIIGGDQEVGEPMVADRRLPLISATGSCRMGRRVGQVVAGRLGRSLLELGGNNAIIVEPDANLNLALKSIVFGSVGTCGQRCTTTRRLIVHESIADALIERLATAYRSIIEGGRIGDPLDAKTLVGPLITDDAAEAFENAIETAMEQGGRLVIGGKRHDPARLAGGVSGPLSGGFFVEPTIIRMPPGEHLPIAMEETFAPILYVTTYRQLEEAIELQNAVDQGLSSAIFTGSVSSMGRFLDPSGAGSDCGLAYVNLGTSGAEIGGAFGGEKDTGGGRESGSDSWKAYMRRQTCTLHFGDDFALAQGIRFE